MAKILVAEDDRRALHAISAFLRRSGYQVVEAGDEIQAIDLVARDGFDLVLSDVFMPHDGFRLLSELRSISPDVPIILMTGHSHEALARALSLGAADCLMKPFSLDELADKVRDALKRQPAGRTAPKIG